MNLIYSDYDIVDLPNESLILSSHCISKVTSEKLISIMHKLKKHQAPIEETHLTDTLLKLELPKTETIQFLQQAIGLKIQPEDIYFKKLLITHDWEDKNEIESVFSQELNCKYKISENLDTLLEDIGKQPCFICIICTQYDYARLKKTYFSLADANPYSAISVAYFNGNTFIVDQPYMASIGNPCHFCQIDRQLNHQKFSNSRNSWPALLKFCMERNTTLPIQKPGLLQRSLAIGLLVKKIKLHTEGSQEFRYQDDALSSITVDLDSGFITEESNPHWHSCNCLRSKNEKYSA
ncbi:McbB family protein [Pseudomonas sp. C1C7]|uniref:McbB family protein n=1 Tax=Pseudomonas sp. C1C7 TaxID=2735272 RepID=UPI00158674FB|nr:McbB family protein [Pseudomonas sp. C1C7]NUT78563.1 McbB family protein [Pseudomonas sp. C1C7]